MKLAYADRDKYYGDHSFVSVPLKQLLSGQYAKIRFPLIDMKNASQLIRPGDPVNMHAYDGPGEHWPGEKGTTTWVVVDKWGNVVAATPSANPEYGICEDLGIAHNTRLSSLNTQKGHSNSIEPGKRPRITLTRQQCLIFMKLPGQLSMTLRVAGKKVNAAGLSVLLKGRIFGQIILP